MSLLEEVQAKRDYRLDVSRTVGGGINVTANRRS